MIKAIHDLSQIITLDKAYSKDGRKLLPEDLSIINNASVVYDENEILWIGETSKVPSNFSIKSEISKPGHILTPALIDSHTHLVFGGDRSFEYSLRLNGADYEEIAKAGGGILNTMDSTKNADEESLFSNALKRIEDIYSYGIKTIEIKSGYALTTEGELRITKVIDRLKKHFSGKVKIFNTFMAAHAVPKDFKSSKDYLEQIVIPLLHKSKDVVDAVDIFFEQGYFSKEDTILLFKEAELLKIPVKMHADEFNDNKGAILASEFNALSADHLLCTTADGIKAIASSSTVACILPGTAFFLGKDLANARAFLDAGAKVALASDYNPGSCHCDNLLLIASISAKKLNMNITELWAAITLNAAAALGIKNTGAIIKGLEPNFSLFEVPSIDMITYSWGKNFNREF